LAQAIWACLAQKKVAGCHGQNAMLLQRAAQAHAVQSLRRHNWRKVSSHTVRSTETLSRTEERRCAGQLALCPQFRYKVQGAPTALTWRPYSTQSSSTPEVGSAPTRQGENGYRKIVFGVLKLVGLWVPAFAFWLIVVVARPAIDLRTDEEVQDEEEQMLRLERFFAVEALPDAEYWAEWQAKNDALAAIIDKILRSPKISEALELGPCGEAEDPEWEGEENETDAKQSPPSGKKTTSEDKVEVSFVLPPPAGDEGVRGGGGPWCPKLAIAHQSGTIALVALVFEHVAADRNREERLACTQLCCDVILDHEDGLVCERLCDIRGPPPHGIRYMRI